MDAMRASYTKREHAQDKGVVYQTCRILDDMQDFNTALGTNYSTIILVAVPDWVGLLGIDTSGRLIRSNAELLDQ